MRTETEGRCLVFERSRERTIELEPGWVFVKVLRTVVVPKIKQTTQKCKLCVCLRTALELLETTQNLAGKVVLFFAQQKKKKGENFPICFPKENLLAYLTP
jgi:hypothetical protein